MENGRQEPIWSVSEVNRAVREMVETGFSPFWVSGEVGSLLLHRSGHAYFSLKDERAQLRVCWFGGAAEMRRLQVANGSLVEAYGALSVYETKGEYQFNCRQLRLAGRGELFRKFEELKQRLAAEGLFRAERKRPIPNLPEKIGVVTSPNGAAIRDFLNIVLRRFAGLSIKIYPAQVQGEGTAASVSSGIEFFNRAGNVDVIVVTRGGGSMEDLWGFNEETLVRAVASSRIPVISAVGHEIDTTLCDFAADLRVPTPSAAAELVISSRSEIETRLAQLTKMMSQTIELTLSRGRTALENLARRLREPEKQLRNLNQKLDELDAHLLQAITARQHDARLQLEQAASHLSALNPRRQLENGYVFAAEADSGKPLKSSKVRAGVRLRLTFADGDLDALSLSRRRSLADLETPAAETDELF